MDVRPAREFGRRVDRLGGIALRVADDQLDLPAVDAAGGVDLVHGEDGAPVDRHAGG